MITRLRQRLVHDAQSGTPQYVTAGRVGIDPATLTQYALGRKSIKPDALRRLCEYYDCSEDEILGYVDAPDIVDWQDA